MTYPLAAIRFEKDGNVDALLNDVVATLRMRGLTLTGVVQTRGAVHGACHCADMDLISLSNGQVYRISQPLGEGSRGCRLNPEGLADCSAALELEIAKKPDLLILNRFGKGEAEGRGFRDIMGQALLAGIPVLTALRDTYAAEWQEFSGEMGHDLQPEFASVMGWANMVSVDRKIVAAA